ncbi:GTPase-activating protein skywalker-like [Schistocerca gregaria]|uniref:GTPase-activating protein skywalker-like n=1 Tax=Schistocerca gregaria TaxID=7010 RepID=UPI00211E8A1C|nr:GTPase-activating protein skywalker-like [Schistocerca gregaria]
MRLAHTPDADMTKTLKIHAYEFAGTWINHLFVDIMPYYVVIRLFDAYLHQGIQMLFRFGLALLYRFQDQLLKCCKKEDFLKTIKDQIQQTKLPCEIFKLAWKFKIKSSILNWSTIKAMKRCEFSDLSKITKSPQLSYQPKLNFSSKIIDDSYWRLIYSWIPNRHRIKDPVLLFGESGKPELSLKKMYKVTEDWAPTVLLVKSAQDRVFGFFMSCLWRMTKQHEHIGTEECFLFQLIPDREKYGWQPKSNNIFLIAQEELFSMGAGQDGFGLCVCANGMGSSEACETFQNRPLNGDGPRLFRCTELEVFGFE